MDGRYAVFVDAGYLWAAGITAVFGDSKEVESYNRSNVKIDYRDLIHMIKSFSKKMANDRELLRVYWYDAAPDRVPTKEHQKINVLPEVKTRIGHLTANGVQKNVDTMLLLDLNALARQNSISTAVILGGDGDFVEGVATAQSFGVKVYIMAIGSDGNSLSPELRAEADDVLLLGRSDLTKYFTPPPKPQTAKPKWAPLELIGSESVEIAVEQEAVYQPRSEQVTTQDVAIVGGNFARRYKMMASAGEVESTLRSKPQVPDSTHFRLLRYTLEYFDMPWGTLLPSHLAEAMREGFWLELEGRAK
jgi:uncharacterized LabA/DUF88 family protein